MKKSDIKRHGHTHLGRDMNVFGRCSVCEDKRAASRYIISNVVAENRKSLNVGKNIKIITVISQMPFRISQELND